MRASIALSAIPGRIAWLLNFTGACLNVDAACASALPALVKMDKRALAELDGEALPPALQDKCREALGDLFPPVYAYLTEARGQDVPERDMPYDVEQMRGLNKCSYEERESHKLGVQVPMKQYRSVVGAVREQRFAHRRTQPRRHAGHRGTQNHHVQPRSTMSTAPCASISAGGSLRALSERRSSGS